MAASIGASLYAPMDMSAAGSAAAASSPAAPAATAVRAGTDNSAQMHSSERIFGMAYLLCGTESQAPPGHWAQCGCRYG